MESRIYRVYVINQLKRIVSLNVMFDNTKLPAVKGDVNGNPSNSLGGAKEGSTSQTQHHTGDQKDTSRTYLPRQRVWIQDHSWVLVL